MKKTTRPLRLAPETVRPLTALASASGGLSGTTTTIENTSGCTNSVNCRVTYLPGFCY
jgi:hypothetical protein